MPSPREQAALSEASRLLQEGLQLLDERTREVDAMVQAAEERARAITAQAEERAQELTAQAEQRKVELQEQIAALQTEIADIREEMARMKTPRHGHGGRFVSPTTTVEPAPAVDPVVTDPPVEAATSPGAAEAVLQDADASPRWGRQSTLAAQAIRRSTRPRWLPRWFPFLLLLLPVGLALANLTAPEAGAPAATAQQALLPTGTVALAQVLPPTATPPAATSTPLPPPTATRAATPTGGVTLVAASQATATQTQAQTQGPTPVPSQSPLSVPLSRAPPVPPLSVPPGGSDADGAIVAVYTTYFTYIVHNGDTLNVLATQFAVSGDAIIRASGLRDPNLLLPGQVLTIPRETGWLYRVQPNETLDQIAARFGTTGDDLREASMLSSSVVRPGELLFIPNRVLPGLK